MNKNYEDSYEKLGLNIAYYRRREKLTQENLAEILGCDRTHISHIEVGKSGISVDLLFQMAELFKIPAKALFDFRE